MVTTSSYFGDDVDEEEPEREVDEVHPLDEADDQEHRHLQPALCLGLTGSTGDGRVTGEAVTDGGADCTATKREAGGDQRPHQDQCVGHVVSLLKSFACEAAAVMLFSRPSRAMPK